MPPKKKGGKKKKGKKKDGEILTATPLDYHKNYMHYVVYAVSHTHQPLAL